MSISRSLSAFALLAAVAAAHAQSNAASTGRIDYSFAVDPDSAADVGDLSISDNGETTYNLIVPFDGNNPSTYFSPYTAMTGSGVATATVDGMTAYDATTMSGHNGIDSHAYETGPSGTASASVGSQEVVDITNGGANAITLDIGALVQAFGSASATGASSSSNFATVSTYAGFYDYNVTTNTGGINPFILATGSDSAGVATTAQGGFSPIDGSTYAGSFTVTIAPGERHLFEFYTSSKDITSASPVPEPSALAALGLGAVAMLRRRRK